MRSSMMIIKLRIIDTFRLMYWWQMWFRKLSFLMFWCTIVWSFKRANPAMLKKLSMWFQWFIGSKLWRIWPNNTVNTKFCVKIFWGAHKSQPPRKCTVSHCANGPGWPLWTVNFLLLIAQLWPIMTQDDWRWSGLTHHGSWGCQGAYGGTQGAPAAARGH